MRASVFELPASFDRIDERFDDVARLLERGPPVELALLGETALTGYVSPEGDFDLSGFAEPLEGPTLERARALAHRHRTALGLPLVERGSNDQHFNAYVLLDAEGTVVAHYRKRHPWYPETWATAGEAPFGLVELGGLQLCIAICFDIHFMLREAHEALERADLLVFPSAWVDDGPVDGRAALLEQLALRFGVAIANPNWGLGQPRVPGQGASRWLGPEGEARLITSRAGQAARLDALVTPKRRWGGRHAPR